MPILKEQFLCNKYIIYIQNFHLDNINHSSNVESNSTCKMEVDFLICIFLLCLCARAQNLLNVGTTC